MARVGTQPVFYHKRALRIDQASFTAILLAPEWKFFMPITRCGM